MNQYSIFHNGIEYVCTNRNILPHGIDVQKFVEPLIKLEDIGIFEGIQIPEGMESNEDECKDFENKVIGWLEKQ